MRTHVTQIAFTTRASGNPWFHCLVHTYTADTRIFHPAEERLSPVPISQPSTILECCTWAMRCCTWEVLQTLILLICCNVAPGKAFFGGPGGESFALILPALACPVHTCSDRRHTMCEHPVSQSPPSLNPQPKLYTLAYTLSPHL